MLQLTKNTGVLLFLLLWILLVAGDCNRNTPESQLERLEMTGKFKLAIEEPSGLTFNATKNSLLTVSDRTNKIYKISLTGSILKTYPYTGYDVEGITFNNATGDMWIVEERVRDVVQLSSQGQVINQFHIDIDKHSENLGLEGITYNPTNKHLYLVNEQHPDLLVETDLSGNILKETTLTFASDYAGIFYDESTNDLWIVSDESRSVSHCTLSGELIKGYSVNITKPEGIAVNSTTREIFIVSDSNSKLYVYKY